MRLAVTLVRLAGLITLCVSTAGAQSAISAEAGVLSGFGTATPQVGVRFSSLRPRALGFDVSVHTLPEAIAEGFFLGITDVGVSYGIAAGADLWLLPRASVTLLVGVGEGGAGAAPGLGAGIGVVARVSPRLGVRLDVQYRDLGESDVALGFTSVTFGITWIH